MPAHLLKRANRYYVRVAVPKALWDIVGKREVQRTTGTSDLRVAERLKHSIIDQIKTELEATVGTDNNPASPAWFTARCLEVRQQVQRGTLPRETAEAIVDVLKDQHLKALGVDEESTSDATASRMSGAMRAALDVDFQTLKGAITDYLSSIETTVERSTFNAKQKRLDEFAAWSGCEALADVTRKVAGKYVTDVLAVNGLSSTTNKNIAGILSTFFQWAIDRGLSEHENPFRRQAAAFNGSKRGGKRNSYRAWTTDELSTMFDALDKTKPGSTLHKAREVARIALYGGLRLDEVCAMKVTDVNLADRFMVVAEGKNENSVRQVPIHKALQGTLEALVGDRTSGYLIAGLKPGGEDHKRSHSLGNRFSEFKCQLFPNAGRELAFHGLRSTFITAAENAEVPTSTIELIVGHARQSMSYGTYSKGPGLDVLAKAVGRITHGVIDKRTL